MVLPNLKNDLAIFSLVSFILFPVLDFPLTFFSDSTEEAHSLLKWKVSLQNHNNGFLLPSWTLDNVTKISPCAWAGIHCNHAGRVNSVNLTRTGLKGMLCDFSFSSFPYLEYLDLWSNQLFGNIPPQIAKWLSGSIPHELDQLSSLNILALYTNFLQDSIPHSLSNLTNLVTLDLYYNSLSGSIPSKIGSLKFLFGLGLSENKLCDSISPSLGNMTNLVTLILYDNSLSGSIPSEIGNLNSLYYLELGDNKCCGSIPHSLELGHNKLCGSIPHSLGNLTSLAVLSLYSISLSGSIPSEIRNLKSLSDIALSNNKLCGSIPHSLVGMVSRYQSNPGPEHWTAVKHIMKYLKRTKNYMLEYSGDELIPVGYTDSNFMSYKDSRKSTSGYVFTLGSEAISWRSVKQSCIADSTTETEYVVASEAAKEVVWLHKCLQDLEVVPAVTALLKLFWIIVVR
ncbi:hypothetical protein WN943_025868 [Citrus x changshan-huyou]